ncbi:hypothetical protein CDAR_529141 [Caerostris darwini]|uniref:Ycf15 n=1 Tax=Caerostris darwini TaxID=1538125 RepID=A0AAV4TY29_9ARAC|nr:hypothetical protein CDAR_529141 [Caerostris darwini]
MSKKDEIIIIIKVPKGRQDTLAFSSYRSLFILSSVSFRFYHLSPHMGQRGTLEVNETRSVLELLAEWEQPEGVPRLSLLT